MDTSCQKGNHTGFTIYPTCPPMPHKSLQYIGQHSLDSQKLEYIVIIEKLREKKNTIVSSNFQMISKKRAHNTNFYSIFYHTGHIHCHRKINIVTLQLYSVMLHEKIIGSNSSIRSTSIRGSPKMSRGFF